MPTIAYVTHNVPKPIGHGGNHRSYQILVELQQAFTAERVQLIVNDADQRHGTPATLGVVGHFIRLLARTRENPFKLFGDTYFSIRKYSEPAFLQHYLTLIQERRPDICIIDNVAFAGILPINRRFHIPTIACPQNLEAFDSMDPSDSCLHLPVTAYNFANELSVLRHCDQRLFISPVETAVVGGLGYPSSHYPYQPAGLLAEHLQSIKRQRQQTEIEKGLFLMLGSVHHPTTREGMQWLLRQVKQHGLPDGVRLMVVGGGATEHLSVEAQMPGVELCDWMDQNRLDDLFTKVQAVLVPQQRGFGAQTKLIELPYAGIPVIVSKHPLFAVPPSPGLYEVEDDWSQWRQAMATTMGSVPGSKADSRQTQSPLLTAINRTFSPNPI